MSDTLDIETKDMEFNRVYRLEGDQAKKTCPILVNFHCHAVKEKVRLESCEKDIKNTLKDQKQGIGVQMPQQYRDAKKALSEYVKADEDTGKEM